MRVTDRREGQGRERGKEGVIEKERYREEEIRR